MRNLLQGLSLLLVAVLLGSGCSTTPSYAPKSTTTLVLTPENRAPTTSISVVTAIEIQLPSPPAASHNTWVLVGNNVVVLGQMTGIEHRAKPGTSNGIDVISFYAMKPGKSVVRLVLIDPNDKEAVPIERYDVLVVSKE